MPLTLLEIVQTACAELGLTQPAVVASATDLQTKQLMALVNRDGKNAVKGHEWTVLQKQFITNIETPISTTGDTTEGSAVITNIPSTSGIVANYFVCTGNAVPTSARVISVDSATQVTLDSEITATDTGIDLVFARDTYPEPSDFDRFTNNTMWDRTNRWPLLGPSSPQQDQWQRSGVVTVGPRRWYRQIGYPNTNYRFWPPPSTGETPLEFVAEYISKNWVLSSGGVPQDSFTDDDDTPLLSDQLMILGVKWRMWQIKQFDYAPLQAEYIEYLGQLTAQDGPKGTLSMARKTFNPLITPANIQDGFFPGNVS